MCAICRLELRRHSPTIRLTAICVSPGVTVEMEVMAYWRSRGHRIRRSGGFAAPMGAFGIRRRSGSLSACALPQGRRSTPSSATVGCREGDEWSDHHAHYMMNARGQRLFVQRWAPWSRRRPRGRVLLVHGLGDHSNKYVGVARTFVAAGYEVVAFDAHGHGRSQGLRAYCADMRHYVDDAAAVLHNASSRSQHGAQPTFVVGHSLGGAVAIHLAQTQPPPHLKGVLLTAPAVRVYPNPLLRAFAPLIANFAPLLPVQPLRFERHGYRVPRVLRPYVAGFGAPPRTCSDPLITRDAVRARTGMEVLRSCRKIMSDASRFKVPLFVAHAADDRVTSSKGSRDFHRAVASKDKLLQEYEVGGHDLLVRQRNVVRDMVQWCTRHV